MAFIALDHPPLKPLTERELRAMAGIITGSARQTARRIKTAVRGNYAAVGLKRLGLAFRATTFPEQGASIGPSIIVFPKGGTRTRGAVTAFEEGATITAKRRRFIAVPTKNAPKRGTDGKRITPATFPEHRFGPLRFIPRAGGGGFLVADNLKPSFSRKDGSLRGFRRPSARVIERKGPFAAKIMFVLRASVQITKRTDLDGIMKGARASLAGDMTRRLGARFGR